MAVIADGAERTCSAISNQAEHMRGRLLFGALEQQQEEQENSTAS